MAVQLVKSTDWVGRTIAYAKHSEDKVVIRFEDGDYLKLTKERVPYEDYEEIVATQPLAGWELLHAGVIDQAEYDRQQAAILKERQEKDRTWKLRQLEQLRKELEELEKGDE